MHCSGKGKQLNKGEVVRKWTYSYYRDVVLKGEVSVLKALFCMFILLRQTSSSPVKASSPVSQPLVSEALTVRLYWQLDSET